jgi:hypothetical protein
MIPEGFKPVITTSDRPQTHALGGAVTGIVPRIYLNV